MGKSSIENGKHLVDIIKFNFCQLLCYNPFIHNNSEINLAKKAQRFFRKNLDVINVLQNNVTVQKMSKLVTENEKGIFNIYDDKKLSYYKRPVISNN